MNLVRHDLGFSTKESRFPTKATCLAIYSRAVNAEQELKLKPDGRGLTVGTTHPASPRDRRKPDLFELCGLGADSWE
jgi:hypothetical protein